jgi:putative ABC transport system substrate-binding protein
MLNRRRFLAALGAGLLAAPVLAAAQGRGVMPRIVVLGLSSPADQVRAFEDGLRTLGYEPGATIAVEHRSAEERTAALPGLAREAAALQPQAIVAIGTTAAIAASRATKRVPIVAVTGDIVASGLVGNLGRPEGNVTGLSFFAVDLMLKRFDLLLELAPQIRRLTVIIESPPHPTQVKGLAALRAAATKRGVELREAPVARAEDVPAVVAKIDAPRAEGVLLWPSPVFDRRAADIGRLMAEHRLLAMLPWKEYAHAGGLAAYAPDILLMWRRAATYVDRILRGAKPADLPVEQPTRFELVINLRTAKAIGLTIPAAVLVRADQLIE